MSTDRIAIELLVRDHPGVLSHVAGLFARRCFNLEAVLCTRTVDRGVSRMWLLVERDGKLPQVVGQLRKLHDVLEVTLCEEEGLTVFGRQEGPSGRERVP